MRCRAKAKAKDIPPWSLYLAELEDRIDDPTIKLRRTPPGQPTVPDLVSPGDMVRTSYNSGPYIVTKINREVLMHCNEEYPHYALNVVLVERWKANGEIPPLDRLCYLNELVAVDGRLLKLFEVNRDEVFVVEKNFKPIPMRQTTLMELIDLAKRNHKHDSH